MRHAYFDVSYYPWHLEEGRALHTSLYSSIPGFHRIDVFYKAAARGALLPPLSQSQPPHAIWKAALEGLAAAHKLKNLCDFLLQDQSATSVHSAVQRVLNAPAIAPSRDCNAFLRCMEQQTRHLEIPSCIPSVNRRIEIEEVFVDLHTWDRISGEVCVLSPIDYLNKKNREQRMPVIIVGRPGSGKTTYLRRIANEHSRRALRDVESLLPLYCRATELWHHINKHLREFSTDAPASYEFGAWIPHFFGRRPGSRDEVDVPPSFFEENILGGSCLLLIDGVDEVSDPSFYRMVVAAAVLYTDCPMIITTRPRGLRTWNETAGFRTTELQPLGRQQIRAVVKKWSNLLHPNRPDVAQRFVNDTLRTLKAQSDPSYLHMSPGDLTTVIAAWSQNKAFPFSLAKAYEELFTGSLSLPSSSGIPQVLQDLALDMQRSTNERTSSVPIDWAEERVAHSIKATSLESAREFLLRTEEASGLVILSDDWLRFWHVLFQEFLAARALSRLIEAEQLKVLHSLGGRVLHNTWRQPLLFLAEILSYRNSERINGVLTLILSVDCDARSFSKAATKMTLLHEISTRITNPEMVTKSDGYDLLINSLMPTVFSERISELEGPLRLDLAKCYSLHPDPRLTALHWVPIKGGSFYMGAQSRDSDSPRFDRNARRGEGPVRQTSLPDFEITQFPITVGQYRAFMDDGGYDRETFWQAGGFGRFRSPSRWEEQRSRTNLPAVGISWYEASAFCMWANCNLPTEQQWERTAAGLQGRIYPWGNSQPDPQHAAFGSDRPEVAPVALFPEGSTPDCVCDLAGNAWEWTRDAYARYGTSQASATNATEGKKVLRGGSVLTDARFLRCSTRIWAHVDDRYSNFGPVGFRCARPANKST